MKHILRAITHKPIRDSTSNGLRASGTAPASGPTASDNMQGASQASAEILDDMNSVFEDIVIGDDIRGVLNTHLQRLDSKVSLYANSSLDYCASKEPWSCNQREAALIDRAWACSAYVYDYRSTSEQSLSIEGTPLNVHWFLPSSSLGSVKATTFTTYTPAPEASSHAAPSPYLIIAVRGSATKLDHVVNLNGEPSDAKRLFIEAPVGVLAHAGFLNSAKELITALGEQVDTHLSDNPSTNILFTGHSAGGATASLLYLAFRCKLSEKYPQATFSCITFGCPPVIAAVTREAKVFLHEMSAQNAVTNIINEYDFVSRADGTYFRSLIQLYEKETTHPVAGSSTSRESNGRFSNDLPVWSLPAPGLCHLGAIVVLKAAAPRFDGSVGEQALTGPSLSAWKLSSNDLALLIFCRLQVHGRAAYQERVYQLEKGHFNGQTGWNTEA